MAEDNNDYNDDQTRSFTVLAAGTKVSHYKIISKIGVGGMGEVYLAEDIELARNIVLKFLSSNFASDNQFRERFLREARSAAALNHPNIITIYEVSEFQDQIYIAMEYVEGKSLREIMDGGSTSFDYILDLAIQICDGLHAAHQAGLVHRDIKPLNIMVDNNKRVRILDFGLAKSEGDVDLTQAGTAIGTVNYMSPEQGQGMAMDNRSDIFSFGIVLYEMFTGQLPFKTGNIPATIYSIVHEQPPPLKDFNENFSTDLQKIIDKVLAKSHHDRYQNIIDLKNDIINLKYGTQLDTEVIATTPKETVQVSSPQVKSLGVLYLKNLGPEADEYLSYGITEDLIVDLSRIGTIRVAPMRSIMQFKDSYEELNQIGKKLKVNMILDGSIHKTEDKIRISAQLINVNNEETLWSNRWEEPLDNLQNIKTALSDGVSVALNIGQTIYKAAQVGEPIAKDANAYENYLKGKYHFDHKQNKSDVEIALALYKQSLRDEPSLVAAKTGIAEIKIYNGNFSEAKIDLESALDEARDRDLKPDQVTILKLLAEYHRKKSEWDEALALCEQALTLTKNIGDLTGEAEILGIVISILQPQEKYDEIFSHFDRVLEISRQHEGQEQIGNALKNMGIAYSRKGDYEQALQLYEEAIEIAQNQQNNNLEAACLANIGNLFYFQSDLQQAFEHYQKALEIAERLGDKALSARQTLNMGLIELHRNKFREGLALLNKSATSFNELGDRSNYAMNLVNISQARLTIGEVDLAVKAANEALSIAREVNHPLAETDACLILGEANMYTGNYEEAKNKVNEVLEISEKSSNNRNLALGHLLMTRTCFCMNDLSGCRQYADKAYSISKAIGEKTITLHASAFVGALMVLDGFYNAGLKQIEKSIKELEKQGNAENVIQVKILLGYILTRHSKFDSDMETGLKVFNEALDLARKKSIVIEINRIEQMMKSCS